MKGIQAAVTSFIIDIDFFPLNIIKLILLVTRYWALEPKQKQLEVHVKQRDTQHWFLEPWCNEHISNCIHLLNGINSIFAKIKVKVK